MNTIVQSLLIFALGLFIGWYFTSAHRDKKSDRSPDELYVYGYNLAAGTMLRERSIGTVIEFDHLYLHPEFHKGVHDAIRDFAFKRLTT